MKKANFQEEKRKLGNLYLRRIQEGGASIFVPDPNYYQERENEYFPASLPVFYNPLMEINRDISILTLKTYENQLNDGTLRYMEGLAASGIRGFRIAKELDERVEVLLNDRNPQAAKLMEYNNSLLKKKRIKTFNKDVNFLCHKLAEEGKRLDVLEIDPFGTPTPFIHSAMNVLNPKNALLLLTATDLTILHGKYPNVALRKYGSKIIETPFSKEMGVRALMYTIGRIAGIFNRYIRPIFGLFLDNFVKIAVLISESKSKANALWKKIGWLSFCPDCYSFRCGKGITSGLEKVSQRGESNTHEKIKIAGPLWLDPLFHKPFCEGLLHHLKDSSIKQRHSRKLRKFFRRALDGKDLPFFYDINRIAQQLSLPSPKVNAIIEKIKSKGYEAYRTHFKSTGVKTDASVDLIKREIKKYTKRR